MVAIALEARALLQGEHVSCEVIDIHTLKPLDRELILKSAAKTRRVVTVEDHQIHGGLGSAVAELLGEELPTRMRRIGLRDTFAESGEYRLLLAKYHMDAKAVIDAVKELL